MSASKQQPRSLDCVLVVEDEERQRRVLVKHLQRAGFETEDYGSGEEAMAALQAREFSAMLTDIRLPGIDGIEVLRRALEVQRDLPAIVMTGHASLETAIDALRLGAHDYALKPLFFDELVRKLQRIFEFRELARENQRLRRALATPAAGAFLGVSPAAQEIRKWIERAAGSDVSVLITGPTGSGKEVVAQSIHRAAHGDEAPMLAINVAALADAMIESELFGHERGAFTGATQRRDGLLRAAGAGTVFLDEIGEMPLDLQAKLLRALEAREILPVGSDRPVSFEARVLCATHRDLDALVAEGKFRADLRYRLDVLQIYVPPLRERVEDIALLSEHLLDRACARRGQHAPALSPGALRALEAYEWPGNVRELANVLERALLLSDASLLEADSIVLRSASRAGAAPHSTDGAAGLKEAVEDFERGFIRRALAAAAGNREQAALRLEVSQATLYRRLEKLGLKDI